MALPTGWPPRPASSVRSIRFFATGNTTANWSDNAYLFINGTNANPYKPTPYVPPGSSGPGVSAPVGDRSVPGSPMGGGQNPHDVAPGDTVGSVTAMIWCHTMRICNDGTHDLQISFTCADDSSNDVHDVLKGGEQFVYEFRFEAGVALRFPSGGSGSAFRIAAW